MKAISLLQPWASLVVLGFKTWETRSWNTSYRGRLQIHASVRKDATAKSLCITSEWFHKRIGGLVGFYKLPFGAIIGEVTLAETMRTDTPYILSEEEFQFGDYSPGRWMWKLNDPVVWQNPIPCKGALSIWNYDGPVSIG